MNTNDIKELLINNKEAYFIESNDQVFYIKPYYLFNPELKGETGAQYRHSYSESNGEAVGKGFWLNGGWDNSGLWELNFDFKHDNIQYTGILFVGKMEWATDYPAGLTTWEGSWTNGEKYANYNSGSVGYFDVKVTKIDATHVRLQSKQLNRDTIAELTWLPDYAKVSCGAHHHGSSSAYGPCRIKNVKVVPLLYVPQLTGNEATRKFGGYGSSLSIADGVMSNGCNYLTDGWDNTVDWELEFDWKISGTQCGVVVVSPDVTSRDTRRFQMLGDGRISIAKMSGSRIMQLIPNMASNTWYHVQIKKIGNTLYLEEDGKTCKIDDWDVLQNYDTLCIGVDSWGSNASIKNIKVKQIQKAKPESMQMSMSSYTVEKDESIDIDFIVYDKNFNRYNQEVPIEVYKNDELIDTVQTNSNGEASIKYIGSGSGNVTIKAKCDWIEIEDTIEDLWLNDDCTGSNVYKKWMPHDGDNTAIYTSFNDFDTLRLGGTNNASSIKGKGLFIPINWDKFTIEFDFYSTNIWNWTMLKYYDPVSSYAEHFLLMNSYDSSSEVPLNVKGVGYNKWNSVRLEVDGMHGEVYVNGVKKASTDIVAPLSSYILLQSSYYTYFKNIKISSGKEYIFDAFCDKNAVSVLNSEQANINLKIKNQSSINENPQPLYNETFYFDIFQKKINTNGDEYYSLIDNSSINTNEQGEGDFVYQSQELGDIKIVIPYRNQVKICNILDVYYYNSLTTDTASYDNTSNCSVTYSPEGMKILGTKSSDVYITNTDIRLPSNYSLEMTIVDFNDGWNTDICIEDMFLNNNDGGVVRKISNSGYNYAYVNNSYQRGDVVKFIRDSVNKSIDIYYNDVYKTTINNIDSTGYQKFKTYTGRYLTVKDLIVRRYS